jgi:hypothetical protein
MSAFEDLWVAPASLIDLVSGLEVEAWDFRDLVAGQLVSVNSCLINRERVACTVVERLGDDRLKCGSSPVVLSVYRVRAI